jgi:hypothetical protein
MFQQSTITSQDRLQPMDKWEDYPIKVLDIAQLIMVTLPTVSSFFSTCGCFLRDGRSSSGDLPPLSLAGGWPPRVNGSPLCGWRCLQDFRVENPSGAKKGGPNRTPEWARPAGLGRSAQVHPGPVRSPLRSRGCTGDYALCPFHLHDFDDVILVQDGGSPCMKFGLLRFYPRGCSYVALRSLPPLEVISWSSWTQIRLRKCSFELPVNSSFMSMFSYINTTLPNACT